MECIKLSAEHIRKLTEWYGPDVKKWPEKDITLVPQEVIDDQGNLIGHTLRVRKLTKEEKNNLAALRELREAEEALRKTELALKQLERRLQMPAKPQAPPAPKPRPPPPPTN